MVKNKIEGGKILYHASAIFEGDKRTAFTPMLNNNSVCRIRVIW